MTPLREPVSQGEIVYAALVKRAKLRGHIKASLLSFVMVFYSLSGTLFAVRHLYARLFEEFGPHVKDALPGGLHFFLAGFSAFLVWAIPFKHSLAHAIIFRTDRVLKNIYRNSFDLRFRSTSGIIGIYLFLLTLLLSILVTEINLYSVFSEEGLAGSRRILGALLDPNWVIFGELIDPMIETIFIAFLATLLAVPLAFGLSFFASLNLMKGSYPTLTLYSVLRLGSNLLRSVEPLVWAVIFSVWVGIGPFAGMVALMIHSVASLIKLYSEQIESINVGPVEALQSTGAGSIAVVWFSVVPQVVLPFLSYTIYRWDINIRMATVIGLVGGGGIGQQLNQFMGQADWSSVGVCVFLIASVVWLMDYLSAKIREAIY